MTLLWIILAAIVAAVVALFQYGYIFTSKKKSTRKPWFALLRFLTVFAILLLFIGPRFNRTTSQEVKPILALVVDDSKSIDYLKARQNLEKDLATINQSNVISNSFEIEQFTVGNELATLDSLTFSQSDSRLELGITQPQELFKNRNKAIIYFTDGNQTVGADYQYAQVDAKTKLYPIIYGDTTQYPDLKITQLNVNRYSYLENEFPVEVFLNYSGNTAVTTNFRITNGKQQLHQQRLNFSPENPSQVVTVNITSTRVGTQSMRATIAPLESEKNTSNNYRNFAVEVIDQQTKILILSDIMHPDLGALKKAIESNQQRSVTIATTGDKPDLNDYNVVIMYSPDSAFAKAYSQAALLNKNTWTITGPDTDYDFLNTVTKAYQIEPDEEFDDAQPILNTAYASFNLEEFDYGDFPPVKVPFGSVSMNTAPSILMYKKIGNVETVQPLWYNYEDGESRHSVLLAEGFWRWRAQSYLDQKDFKNWDDLVSSQVQYLASNKKRNRLEVDYKSFYYQNNKITINAQYLDKNYEFEDNGILNLRLKNKSLNAVEVRPFILEGNSYLVDLSGLDAGAYSFTVTVENDVLSRSGNFSILEFDIEQQFVSANASGMKQLLGTDQVYYSGNTAQVIDQLKNDPLFKPVQRLKTEYATLIDWEYLLGIILVLLGLEWFLRKYNGLI